MSKPTVTVNSVANKYAGPHERIVEVSSPAGGCLISVKLVGEDLDRLVVEVYRADETVEVYTPTDTSETA